MFPFGLHLSFLSTTFASLFARSIHSSTNYLRLLSCHVDFPVLHSSSFGLWHSLQVHGCVRLLVLLPIFCNVGLSCVLALSFMCSLSRSPSILTSCFRSTLPTVVALVDVTPLPSPRRSIPYLPVSPALLLAGAIGSWQSFPKAGGCLLYLTTATTGNMQ